MLSLYVPTPWYTAPPCCIVYSCVYVPYNRNGNCQTGAVPLHAILEVVVDAVGVQISLVHVGRGELQDVVSGHAIRRTRTLARLPPARDLADLIGSTGVQHDARIGDESVRQVRIQESAAHLCRRSDP